MPYIPQKTAMHGSEKQSSTLHCKGGQYKIGDDAWQDNDCRNSKGEDHRKSSDYTHGLQITYFFR